MDTSRLKTSSAFWKTALFAVLFLAIGAAAGLGAKALDNIHINPSLPQLAQMMDFSNAPGRLAVYIFAAAAIAFFVGSPFRSALYSLAFAAGMVGCYHYYVHHLTGLPPKDYLILIVLAPILAYICWYATGSDSILSLVITSCILALMINLTFSYGMIYCHPNGVLELVLLAGTLILLKRKKLIAPLVLAVALAILTHDLPLPIQLW